MGYVSEDRKQEGLILMHSITRNVAITIWRRLANVIGLINPRAESRAVAPFVKRLDVRTPSLGQLVGNLSGGNQQKVSIAKWLAAESEILIIDEPTVGIDIKTKTYLHELIGEIAREGAAILLISSDMAEMITLADRILVMHGFRTGRRSRERPSIRDDQQSDHRLHSCGRRCHARARRLRASERRTSGGGARWRSSNASRSGWWISCRR